MDDRPCMTLDLGYKGLSFRIVTFQIYSSWQEPMERVFLWKFRRISAHN